MDPRDNPYAPGAGSAPPELAGRADDLEAFDVTLDRVAAGRHDRSMLITGLRGVGKTVLLNAFQEMAVAKSWETVHIEASQQTAFAMQLLHAFRSIVLSLSPKRRAGDRVERLLGILHSFSLTLPGEVQIGFDVGPVAGRADSGSLQRDLLDVLEELGLLMRAQGTGVLLLVTRRT